MPAELSLSLSVTVNGEPRRAPAGASIADLVLMLEGRDGAKLRTLGDLGLAQRLFGALASSLKGGSPLGLRAGG